MEKICYIIGAGENSGLDFTPAAGDYVIAADGGLRYLQAAGIEADMVIGDFDTLGYCPEHKNVIRLSVVKDDTDTLAAVREGVKLGYRLFHIHCGLGGRIEHSLANLQVAAYLAEDGRRAVLFDKDNAVTIVKNQKVSFPQGSTGIVSVFAYSPTAEGVYESGMMYDLNDKTLTNTFPLGVSNRLEGKAASVSVREGLLLVVYPKSIKEVSII